MSLKNALVAGATGLVGSNLLRVLLEDTYYQRITVITRTHLDITDDRIDERIIDFTDLGKSVSDIVVDDVFCCLGTTMKKAGSRANFKLVDYQYPVELASAMHKNGANQYLLVSAIGANPDSLFFYNRVKGQAEKKISELGFQGFQIFRPSILLGERSKRRLGERIGKHMSAVFSFAFIGPFKNYKAIEASRVALGMCKLARVFPKGNNIYKSHQIRSL